MTHPQYTQNVIDRFWSRVDRSGGPDACWIWQAGKQTGGYPKFSVNNRTTPGHRFAYEVTYGAVPDGLQVLHSCPDGDRRDCVNPKHLRAGTHAENMQDMAERGGLHYGRDHWVHHLPERIPHGERHPNAKVTAEQVREIRQRTATGEKRRLIAADYGISERTVKAIVLRQNWGHIE